MNLTVDNINLSKQIIDTALTDSFYTTFMTLDGDAQLGNSEQQVYKVIWEDGSVISGSGELESAAYEVFYE